MEQLSSVLKHGLDARKWVTVVIIYLIKRGDLKRSKKWLKALTYFLSGLILLQSCTVYRSTPVNLKQAAEQKLKTKVRTTDDKTFKFDYISYENGSFYGVRFYEMNKKSGEFDQMPLKEEEISNILIQNKPASTLVTILIVSVPIVAIAVIGIKNADLGPSGSF